MGDSPSALDLELELEALAGSNFEALGSQAQGNRRSSGAPASGAAGPVCPIRQVLA